jgi:hypothetical protein
MKKHVALSTVFALLLLFFSKTVSAQQQLTTTIDCYASNKKKGDDYRVLRKFDLAVQQYQAAKYCKGVSKNQLTELDNLIALAKKQDMDSKKIIIRKY